MANINLGNINTIVRRQKQNKCIKQMTKTGILFHYKDDATAI